VTLEAVVFDVDFTIAKPGPDLGPEGYRALGQRFGLDLDPALYEEARRGAIATLERNSELDHDEEVWVLFTERIIQGMGGNGDTYSCARAMTLAWERADHFELYEDALPVIAELRNRGLKLALLSNTGRDLNEFVAHHRIDVDVFLTSRLHGKTKPHETIFRRILELLDVRPEEALMVGDTLQDDVEGARAVGMQAVLIDRVGRYPGSSERIRDLTALGDIVARLSADVPR